jgi:apolipoprotein N-acyltransferase
MIFRNPSKRHVWQAEIVVPMIVIVLLFVGGSFHINRTESPGQNSLRVASVQPSVPQTLIWSSSEDEKRFAELLAVSQQAMTNKPDLLLWPESAVPMFNGVYSAISRFAQTNKVFILFNGDDAEFKPDATNFFNAAFLIRPDGNCTDVYHKQKLVIFGEYIPLVRWLPFLKWFTPITDGWTPGDKPAVFIIDGWGEQQRESVIALGDNRTSTSPNPSLRLAPLICFEDMFPSIARKAAESSPDFLVNLTNDGWFSDSAEQWQHLASAVFRAVENGIPLIRSANNGITCWIDRHGRVQQTFRDTSGSEYGLGVLTMEIPLPAPDEKPTPTFYRRHGDWFAWLCAAVTVASIIAHKLKRH